jgi:hypothetical protein
VVAAAGASRFDGRDPHRRLRDVPGLNDGRLATVRVPGREEDDKLVLFPFEE